MQERQKILDKRDKESAAANLADDLAGSEDDDSEGDEELGWGTIIAKCTPVNEQVEFPANTWLTYCSRVECWSNSHPCKFVWCPKCRASVLKFIKQKLGVEGSDDGDNRRISRRGEVEIDVEKDRGECGAHTYADLLKSVAYTDQSCQYDRMLRMYGESKVGNIPRNCWGCGKLL